MNRKLEINKSEIIKEDFVNPKWTSDIYTTGFVNRVFIKLSKVFFFLKKINFLKTNIRKLKTKINSYKLKKYFK